VAVFAFGFLLRVAVPAGDLTVVEGPELVEVCAQALHAWDMNRAVRCSEELLSRSPHSSHAHAMAVQVAFMRGDYAAARRHLANVDEETRRKLQPIVGILDRLQSFHESLKDRETKHFRIRWAEAPDGVVAEYAPEVLEAALDSLRRKLRWEGPAGKINVEIYPDIETFSTASTLTPREITTSGAVAICKFNRLMLVSPRLYGQGYSWSDTLAHELTHYVVIRKTANRIPVWLHEGVAKYCEELWRNEGSEKPLEPLHQTLLAEAVETNHFIGFERMHLSLVKLDSQEDVMLAYAEVLSFVHFLSGLRGAEAVPRLLEEVAGGKGPEEALSAVAGMPFEELHEKWRGWLTTRDLKRIPGLRVLSRELKQGGGRAEDQERISSDAGEKVQRWVRLGDMLRDEARPAAAAIEYGKAAKASERILPPLLVRLARARMRTGDTDGAAEGLERLARYYEDYFPLHVLRGQLESRRNRPEAAIPAMERAIQIKPFDPRPHRELVGLYAHRGDQQRQAREERVLELLSQWLR
jgi:tetratricopeptide (TPR) repeat protein